MRVVLDANVYIDSYIAQDEICTKILSHVIRDRELIILVSIPIIKEISGVLNKKANKKKLSDIIKVELNTRLSTLMSFTTNIRVETEVNYCRHMPDNKYISCAIDGNADFIISADGHLLEIEEPIKNKKGVFIKISTPEAFLNQALKNKVNRTRL